MINNDIVNQEVQVYLYGGYNAATVRAKTDKALLVEIYGSERWLPLSQIEIDQYGDHIQIHIEEWLAKKIEEELEETP